MSFWCPCVTFSQTSEIVDRGSCSCGLNGAIYLLIACVTGCPCCYSFFYRLKMRKQNRIEGLHRFLDRSYLTSWHPSLPAPASRTRASASSRRSLTSSTPTRTVSSAPPSSRSSAGPAPPPPPPPLVFVIVNLISAPFSVSHVDCGCLLPFLRFVALQSVPFGMLDFLWYGEHEQLDETFPRRAKGCGFFFNENATLPVAANRK